LTIAGVIVTYEGRPPLNADWLQAELIRPDGLWRDLQVVDETRSTHDDLLAAARCGAAEGTVLVAEAQTAGRGRMGRSWVSPPRAGLTFSVLLRPAAVPLARRGWLPLLTGVAVTAALRGDDGAPEGGAPEGGATEGGAPEGGAPEGRAPEGRAPKGRVAEGGVDAWLKWPNDVIVNGEKLAGILAEQAGDAIVVGAGINVSTARDELPAAPVTPATSLALAGAPLTDRDQLLVRVLRQLEHWYLAWSSASGDPAASELRHQYQRLCATIGRSVRAQLPGGTEVTGIAREIDDAGQLVVESATGLVPVSAGDIVHLR
jgi:BirA family transcriptional regulator, biotin operon repressor / biotin---[acetyl-CoA-carboxylase] ligase